MTRDTLDSVINNLNDWTKSTLREWRQSPPTQGPPPAMPARGPPVLTAAVSATPSWSGKASLVLASREEWVEEEVASDPPTLPRTMESQETSTAGGPPSLIKVVPPPQGSGEMALSETPAARAGPTVLGDDVPFPSPPVLSLSSLADDLAATLQRMEEVCHAGIAARLAPASGSSSRRSKPDRPGNLRTCL